MASKGSRALIPWSFFDRFALPVLVSILVMGGQPSSDYLLIDALLIWYAGLLFSIIREKRGWLFYVFWVMLTAYCSTAWLLDKNLGIKYWGVSSSVIFDGTKLSLEAVLVSYVITNLLTVRVKWSRFFERHVASFQAKMKCVSTVRILLASLCLLVVGIHDFTAISHVGLENVLLAPRQMFRSCLLSVYHRVTFLTLPAAVLLISFLILGRGALWKRAIVLLALFVYWTPFILVGSRRELIFVLLVGLLLLTFKYQKTRLPWIILIIMFLVGVLSLPFLIRGNVGVDLVLEFVFPQYTQFLLMDNPSLYSAMRSIYTFDKGLWLMFPAIMRPLYLKSPGLMFQREASLGFGIAFHPMAEAFLNSQTLALLVFVLLTTTIILLVIHFGSFNSVFVIIGFPYLSQWGRSDFWTTFVFVFYSGIVLSVLLTRIKVIQARRVNNLLSCSLKVKYT